MQTHIDCLQRGSCGLGINVGFSWKVRKEKCIYDGGRRIRASCQFKLEPLGLIVIIIIICKILQSSKRKIKGV